MAATPYEGHDHQHQQANADKDRNKTKAFEKEVIRSRCWV
ncbi:protein of unknown function [Trichlorobacter ammonificans]|uniref:Uncharacterized protein n=1 Tax=Trichlorobacter ammonificans TaxID=2916410 RepID=A0ABM9DBL4_9BACT|nr:protein of unknown function [Trichlorobacter ammonificans]